MATLLYRLGKACYRRWLLVIVAWLVALVGIGFVTALVAKPYVETFSIPGIPSEEASAMQSELFPDAISALNQPSVSVVVAAPKGSTLADPEYAAAVDQLIVDLQTLPQMPDLATLSPTAALTTLKNPVALEKTQEQLLVQAAKASGGSVEAAKLNAAALSPLSKDDRVGIISFDFAADSPADVEDTTKEALIALLDDAQDSGLTAEAGGPGMRTQAKADGLSEALGLAVALIVLVLSFGSFVAAGLPLISAVVGLGIGISGVTAMTAFTELSSSTPQLAAMIGLGVGIDYALFILARYRSELDHTDNREEAVGIAVGTAGSAVVFAGLTVVVALAALTVVRIPFLSTIGLAGAFTVTIAVLVALTLLPAMLGVLKSKAFKGRVLPMVEKREADGKVINVGVRWARTVRKHPIAALIAGSVALIAIATPITQLHLAFPSDSTAGKATTQRQAADLINENFGAGRLAPMVGVVDLRDVASESRPAAIGTIVGWAAGLDDVANAQVVAVNDDSTGAQLLITPESGPEATSTVNLLSHLREGQAAIEKETGAKVGVTGLTPIQTDVSERLLHALPIYMAIVIGLALILLMLVFRSVLVPVIATLGFLLSVTATLGATVAIFQQGLFGIFAPQPLVSSMPIFLIGLVFGLAMDYQVFLVTRMREAHVHGADATESVVDGFRNSARVVTSAALIMTSVFGSFILQPDPVAKSMGFALAIAVLFDAFVVRMTLVPALMYLIGERVWWLPTWLDRTLPEVDVEGEKLDRPHMDDFHRVADGISLP